MVSRFPPPGGLRAAFASVLVVWAAAVQATAGGTPENALLIIDPSRPDAMYVGNYYRNVRRIPERNVLYFDPGAPDYVAFAANNLPAVSGTLANQRIEDHIDYIILAPPGTFFMSDAGLVRHDSCFEVTRISVSSAYATAFWAPDLLDGMRFDVDNGYYRNGNAARYFSSSIAYLMGGPSDDPAARRYYLAFTLGYTGERGNTPAELIDMIDRSVAADGARPLATSTFYFMRTTDMARSSPRDGWYQTVADRINNEGGQAEVLDAVLPDGRHDCQGIMTGWPNPPIDTADMTILPGAICDHLTSFAARFDSSSQTKLSRWIARGASGSHGTVEEPCNYSGKFPHARMHLYYFRGLSLGEAMFRSLAFFPFQGLMYGDPLTRPFAFLPSVDVPDAPGDTVSGTITLTPGASTPDPAANIAGLDLLVDGVLHSSIAPGGQFTLNTAALPDGWHDLRVLAYDDTLIRSVGRWLGSLISDNRGRSTTLTVSPSSGDWTTAFDVDLAASGADVVEVRLVQNGRVIAAAPGALASLAVYGLTLGAGPVEVQAETLYADGERVRSAPQALSVAFGGGTPSGQPPVAFSYVKRVLADQPFVVELPATFDDSATSLSYFVLTLPSQATVVPNREPYRLMFPASGATGTDTFTFRVDSAAGSSNVATVTLVYTACVGDVDGDNVVGLSDLSVMLANFGSTSAGPEDGDLDGDGDVDLADLSLLLSRYGTRCWP